jgi:penicillin-binding protein 2
MQRDLFGNPSTRTAEISDTTHIEITGGVEAIDRIEDGGSTPTYTRWIKAVLLVVGSVLVLQAAKIQLVDGQSYRALAQGNSIMVASITAERGLIIDSTGAVLAQNDRRVGIALNPKLLPRTLFERQAVYKKLQTLGLITDEQITLIEQARVRNPQQYTLKTSLTEEENLLLREALADVPSILFTEVPVRKYADLASWGQLVGSVGQVTESAVARGLPLNARIGRDGLEAVYQDVLAGTPGSQALEVNAGGVVLRSRNAPSNSAAIPGSTLQLSLNATFQAAVAQALTDEMSRRTTKYGPSDVLGASAVVINPKTGGILAMVSLPDFPSNSFAQGIGAETYATLTVNAGKPLLNRAVAGQYAPGSTLKPLVAAAGLAEGLITVNTTMNTPEAIVIGQSRFPDWKLHGVTNTRRAIAESNNIFFYALGGGWEERNFTGLGIDRMNRYLAQFGLGSQTGIDLTYEANGLLPTPQWKHDTLNERWFIGNTYQAAIGQGYLLATPLQMALGTAAIANGGTVWTPRLAEALVNPLTNERTPLSVPAARSGFIDAYSLQVVREGMRQAVTEGSARLLNGLKVQAAGKTGTAQYGTSGRTHAWFTGFAPYDDPEIAFAIVIEGGGESFYSSVPVAEAILRAYFNEPLEPGQSLLSAPSAEKQAEIAGEFSGER